MAGIVSIFTEQARRLRFAFEAFVPLGKFKPFPYAEMLARHPDGRSAGHIFDQARQEGCVVETDLAAFQKAIGEHLRTGIPASMNLNAETFFTKEFSCKLRKIITRFPGFSPRDICLEITEQGGIPENFNPETLIALKDMGFRLALDDFDPHHQFELDRLTVFAPYVDIIKFPYQVMELVRDGNQQESLNLADTVRLIKDKYPDILFVMEGVRETDHDLLPTLKQIGIDMIQPSSYVAPPPSVPVDCPEMRMALAL